MSGPQLVALVAIVVALAALVGVAALVLQVRRLRAEMPSVRATPDPVGDRSAEPGTDRVPVVGPMGGAEAGAATAPERGAETAAGRGSAAESDAVADEAPTPSGEPPLPSRSAGRAEPFATVVELVPVPSDPAGGLPADLHRRQQVLAARLAQPLVRVSAVSYGVRHALRAENRDRVVALVRRDLRRRHKLRRLAGRRAFRVVRLRPDGSTGPGADRQESAS